MRLQPLCFLCLVKPPPVMVDKGTNTEIHVDATTMPGVTSYAQFVLNYSQVHLRISANKTKLSLISIFAEWDDVKQHKGNTCVPRTVINIQILQSLLTVYITIFLLNHRYTFLKPSHSSTIAKSREEKAERSELPSSREDTWTRQSIPSRAE